MASRKPASPRALPRGLKDLPAANVQLRIELLHVQPHVWRRVIVPETVTLAKLHQILQAAMGWTDSHLHEYVIARKHYGTPDPDWPAEEPLHDERRAQLKSFIEARVQRLTYLYDFGDSWEHEITVEDILPPKDTGPRIVCKAGENAVLRKTSVVRAGTPRSWRRSQIHSTSNTRKCSTGSVTRSIRLRST